MLWQVFFVSCFLIGLVDVVVKSLDCLFDYGNVRHILAFLFVRQLSAHFYYLPADCCCCWFQIRWLIPIDIGWQFYSTLAVGVINFVLTISPAILILSSLWFRMGQRELSFEIMHCRWKERRQLLWLWDLRVLFRWSIDQQKDYLISKNVGTPFRLFAMGSLLKLFISHFPQ